MYVKGNPVRYSDPTGHYEEDIGEGNHTNEKARKENLEARAKSKRDLAVGDKAQDALNNENAHEQAAEIAKHLPDKEKILDDLQADLDKAGLAPVVGEPADVVNAGISAIRGNYIEAVTTIGCALPVAGWGFSGAKNALKYSDELVDAGSGIVNKGGRFADIDKLKDAGEVAHHMTQNAYNRTIGLSRANGPALGMSVEDHALTRTFKGKGKATMKADADLSSRQRLAVDISDIRKNFGSKYNKGLREMMNYARTLSEFSK